MSDSQETSLAVTHSRRPIISAGGCGAFFVGIALVIATCIFGSQWFLSKTGGALLGRAQSAFEAVFHMAPRTIIQSGSVILEKTSISELAVTQRKMRTVVNYKQAWLGSTKILIVQGDFVVKAGFDLNQHLRFSVNETNKEVVVELGAPKILSMDFKGHQVLYSGDGLMNKLTPADSEKVVKQMMDETRREAELSDLKQEAKQQVEQRIKDLMGGSGAQVTVRFVEAPAVPNTGL